MIHQITRVINAWSLAEDEARIGQMSSDDYLRVGLTSLGVSNAEELTERFGPTYYEMGESGVGLDRLAMLVVVIAGVSD